MYAHDDLIQAITMSEQQFAEFIYEYQQQMMIHSQLTDKNNQISQLHKIADKQLESQANDITNTFKSLGDLYNKI